MIELVELDTLATRADWLRARQQGIGGSDVGALMGLSPFAGPFDVYASKIEPIDDDEEESAGPLARLGQLLEDGISLAYAEQYGATIEKPTHLYGSSTDPWRIASPDRWTDHRGRGVLEVKQGHSSAKYEDGLPDYIELQCLHYIDVLDVDYCDVVVLMHGRDLLNFTVERDESTLDALRSVEEEFWGRVLRRDPPPPDHLATETLKRMYRTVRPKAEVDVRPEMREIIAEYVIAKAEAKRWKDVIDGLGNQMRAAVGDAEIARIDGETAYTWKASYPEVVDLDALEADNPGLLDLYRRPTLRRTLNLNRRFIP